MTDYSKFDAMLVERVRHGANTYSKLCGGALLRLGDELGGSNPREGPQGWRVLDRRLQALRKKAVLRYAASTGWTVAEQPQEETT
jgi:hypothetical protein